MPYQHTILGKVYRFDNLQILLAKASPFRTGDALAGLSAETYEERVAAQITLADVPLKTFLNEAIIPYEEDEVTRLIIDNHDTVGFDRISHLTVGQLRDWLLKDETDTVILKSIENAVTPRDGSGGI
jgi:ethanolamine ammonia-lyase large subunit